jgi:hypothetical protein
MAFYSAMLRIILLHVGFLDVVPYCFNSSNTGKCSLSGKTSIIQGNVEFSTLINVSRNLHSSTSAAMLTNLDSLYYTEHSSHFQSNALFSCHVRLTQCWLTYSVFPGTSF